MIRSIGNDQTTVGTPSSGTRPAATHFAEVFGSLTANDPTASPPSVTTRSSSAGNHASAAEEATESATLKEALAAFKKELSMTPAERVRRDVLKSMDLTEEAIETLPPKERAEVEQKVAMEVARRMKIMQGGGSGVASSPTSVALA